MSDHACYIFFRHSTQNLETASTCLSDRGMTVLRKSDEIEVSFPGNPILRITFTNDVYVQSEAKELSKNTPFSSEMSKCNARFEILIDDLDAILDEINTLIDAQVALQQLTHGYLYLTWNGQISEP